MSLICFADVLGRALGQSDSEEVELGSHEVMEDDDGVKEKPKINIFSVAFNVGTVVVPGISIVLIWVLPQQEGQDEVEAAATHEVCDYQRSEFDSDVEAGSLADGSDSDVADFGPEHAQSPSCDHAAGFVSHRRICERDSHATRYEITNIQAQATTYS